jgi:type IV pilus biogenesis protein CpaD/CtpE
MAVIEVTAFTVVGDEAKFLAADSKMQTDFAYQQPGLLRRTTARGSEQQWLVLTMWRDDASADAAAQRAREDAVAQAFAACVEPGSVRSKRYTPLEG